MALHTHPHIVNMTGRRLNVYAPADTRRTRRCPDDRRAYTFPALVLYAGAVTAQLASASTNAGRLVFCGDTAALQRAHDPALTCCWVVSHDVGRFLATCEGARYLPHSDILVLVPNMSRSSADGAVVACDGKMIGVRTLLHHQSLDADAAFDERVQQEQNSSADANMCCDTSDTGARRPYMAEDRAQSCKAV